MDKFLAPVTGLVQPSLEPLKKAPMGLLIAILVLVAAWIIMKIAKRAVVKVLEVGRVEPALRGMVVGLVGLMGWVVTAAVVFEVIGLRQVSLALVGSIPIMALGLAGGVSGLAGDLIAGIFLIADEDFRVGYRIRTSGIEGVVTSLDIRKTKLVDDEGRTHVLPNKTVDGSIFVVVSRGAGQAQDGKSVG